MVGGRVCATLDPMAAIEAKSCSDAAAPRVDLHSPAARQYVCS